MQKVLMERSKTPKKAQTKLGPRKQFWRLYSKVANSGYFRIFPGSAWKPTRFVQPVVALKAVSSLAQVQQAERERQMQLEEAAAVEKNSLGSKLQGRKTMSNIRFTNIYRVQSLPWVFNVATHCCRWLFPTALFILNRLWLMPGSWKKRSVGCRKATMTCRLWSPSGSQHTIV